MTTEDLELGRHWKASSTKLVERSQHAKCQNHHLKVVCAEPVGNALGKLQSHLSALAAPSKSESAGSANFSAINHQMVTREDNLARTLRWLVVATVLWKGILDGVYDLVHCYSCDGNDAEGKGKECS